MSRALQRVNGAIGTSCAWLAGITFLVVFTVNMVQIVARAAGGGWVWVTDLSVLLFLWLTMLGAVAAYARADHIVTGFLVDRLRGLVAGAHALVIRAAELVFFGILAIAGARVTQVRGGIEYVQLHISTAWAYLAIPVAAALLVVLALTRPLRAPTTEEGV
ncbi:MAG: TRAP transporter small permease subunit [Streptosporangiales bacterium]|nr:TRAP transporter small permease subunit [Streptosporangiales bacterium]